MRELRTRSVFLLTVVAGACGSPLPAQSLVDQLAREVCSCLTAEELVYPRVQADRCMETVLDAHPRRIRAELQLSVRKPEDRLQLEDLLFDPLDRNCPVIRQFSQAAPSPAPRYSDIPLITSRQDALPKHPPADDSERVVSDGPEVRTLTGELTELGTGYLRMRNGEGQIQLLYLDGASQLPPAGLVQGRRYLLTFTLDWRTSNQRVQPRVISVKSAE